MKKSSVLSVKATVLGIGLGVWSLSLNLEACTRALFVANDTTVMTGRTMDWEEDMRSDLWLMPRGIARNGEAGPDSPSWVSKYGSVVTSVYDMASADGMNEKGLVMNILYLAESDYGVPDPKHPPLSVSLWGQYALDNFATVNEAVLSMQAKPFHIIAPLLPNGRASTVHLSLSDASGDSAIFEYVNGQLVVHHGKEYTVMTNSPIYSKQLALNEYWENIGGTVFLPGTNRASDRFARASFFLNAVPKKIAPQLITAVPSQKFTYQATAELMGIMRAVSVPLGITTVNQPNIASTLWRTVANQKDLIYYFDSATSANTFWVSFNKLDFKQGASVRRLGLADGHVFAGEAASSFKAAKAFSFLPAP